MKNESEVRCEHDAQNWHYRNGAGEIVSFRATLTGQVNLETNEISISDHLELTNDEISEFASQKIHEIMSKDLDEQLRS